MAEARDRRYSKSGRLARRFGRAVLISLVLAVGLARSHAVALPPPEDVPEEILREELILQGRSPVDGSALSPVEYAELEAELADFPEDSVAVNPEIQSLVFQLKLLRVLKDVVPFW